MKLMNRPQGDKNFSVARVLFDIIDVEGLMTHMAPHHQGGIKMFNFWGALIRDGRWDNYTAFKAFVME